MTPQQRKAALLVAKGATYEDAGRAVGVSKRTVIRRADRARGRRPAQPSGQASVG